MPFLKRQRFSFGNLKDAIGDDRMHDLRLGEAFASQKAGAQRLLLELKDANPYLKDPITKALGNLTRTHTPMVRDRARSKARRIFAEHGIFADFGRSASIGLILEKTNILGVDTYFVLGKSDIEDLHAGRLDMNGKDSYLMINVTNATGRLIEMLDVMLEVSDPLMAEFDYRLVRQKMIKYDIGLKEAREMITDINMVRVLMRANVEKLDSCMSDMGFNPAEMPVLTALDVITARAGIARLEGMMAGCDDPATFLLKAINSYVAATLAHEAFHILERRANGALRMRKDHMELLAYLIEAVHIDPNIAFSALLTEAEADVYRRGINVREELPELMKDLRKLNGRAFMQDEGYLQIWAERCLETSFMRLAGKPLADVIDVGPIRALRGSEFIGSRHLPLLLASICNPTLRS